METESYSLSPSRTSASYPVSYPHICIHSTSVSYPNICYISVSHSPIWISVYYLRFSVSYPFIYIYLILMLFVIRYFFLSPFPPHPFLSLFL